MLKEVNNKEENIYEKITELKKLEGEQSLEEEKVKLYENFLILNRKNQEDLNSNVKDKFTIFRYF